MVKSELESVWRERIGDYRTINPDEGFALTDFRLSEESGVMCLHYRAPHFSDQEVRLPLLPVSDREAVVMGVDRGAGETLEIVEIDGQPCIRFSGYIGMPTTKDNCCVSFDVLETTKGYHGFHGLHMKWQNRR